ncbi:MAG: WXG100 family type VII secretion target [Haloechinothrix sp.]
MSGYKGEVAEFTAAHQKVSDNKTTIDQELRKLRGNMEATAGQWEGGAATAFRSLMTRFDEDALKLSEALQGISELLQSAGSQYEAQEEEHSQSFSGITSALDG